MPHSIGIDLGTTNVKVVLVSAGGAVLASASHPLATTAQGDTATRGAAVEQDDTATRGAAVEQDADHVWDMIIDCISRLAHEHPDEAARVETIGVCSQYSSIVGVDTTGHPTTPLIMWSDQRGSDHCSAIMSRHEYAFSTWIERHGIPPVGGGLSLAHVLHLQIDHPESHSRTHAYLEPMDYITARLTGTVCATQPSSFMVQLCDNRTLGVIEYDHDLIAMSQVDPTRLAPLIPIESVIGPILPAVAEATGLTTRVLVTAGTNDTSAVAIASGALGSGVAGMAIGTTSVIVDTVEEFRVDLSHEIVSMPGPFDDTYLVMAENGLGGRVLDHVIHHILEDIHGQIHEDIHEDIHDHVAHPNDALGSPEVDDSFASVDVALESSPPGAGGVMFLPWLGGSLAPSSSRDMKGGFINMSLSTSRADMVRSVCEGIAHNLGWLLPHIESLTGRNVNEIRFTGGGARIAGWAQVLADVLDRPVAVVSEPHLATARAAALLSLQRTGTLARTDLVDSVKIGRVHDPSALHRALYDHRQSQFEACFEALLPIHTALGGNP